MQGRVLLLASFFVLGACAQVPPESIGADRFDIGQSLAESWKRQTLINIVRLRYGDAPMFMDVSSVITSRTASGTLSAGASLYDGPSDNQFSFGGSRTWSNTPTLTFSPLSGEKFTKSMLRPVPPAAVMQLIEAGWPANLVLRTTLRSINGIRNQSLLGAGDPRFPLLLQALDRVQSGGALGLIVREQSDGSAVLMTLPGTSNGEPPADAMLVRDLLGLDREATQFDVEFGTAPQSRHQIALQTRSMIDIMLELSFDVQVPASDIEQTRVLGSVGDNNPQPRDAIVQIHSGERAPADAYAAVNYRGRWFWIDDRDITSKGRFSFLMFLFSLAEGGSAPLAPLVAIPSH